MPATSSSVPPRGRSTSICSSDSGKTTHSLPRAFTSDPTAKLIDASQIYLDTGRFCWPNLPGEKSELQDSPDLPGTLSRQHHALVTPGSCDSAHQCRSPPGNPHR